MADKYLAVTVAGAEQAKDVLHGDKFHNQKRADEFIRKGDLETSRHRHKEAIQSYSDAIKLDPHRARAYAGRGKCFSWLDDDRNAIIDFDQALKLVLDDAVTLGLHGECKAFSHDKPDYHGAIEDYTKSIAIERDLPWVFAGRAEVRIALHDYSGAIEDCNVILQKLPNVNRFLFNRAKAENGQGNYQAAWRDLSGLLKADLVKPDGAAHEFGHALGLEHSPNTEDTMYQNENYTYDDDGNFIEHSVTAADKAALHKLYTTAPGNWMSSSRAK